MEIEDGIRRSDEVQDVFASIPPWLIRYGAILVLIIVGLIITGGFLIKYPDTLDGKIIITNDKPPVPLIAEKNGMVRLCVKDSAYVKKGEVVSFIENSTSFQSWIKLRQSINDFDSLHKNDIEYSLPVIENLGELQNSYDLLRFHFQEYKRHINYTGDSFEENSIEDQLDQNRSYKSIMTSKLKVVNREVEILKNRFEKDKELNKNDAISNSELDASEGKYLDAQNKLFELRSQLVLSDERISMLEKQLKEVSRGNRKSKSQLKNEIQSSLLSLRSKNAIFTRTYLQMSPCSGYVTYYDIWDDSHYVTAGTSIAFITSSNENIHGQLKLTGNNFGKVEIGQRVRIILDSYSATKYGIIYGEVQSVSEVNVDNIYSLIIKLPKGLETSYGFKLAFLPNLNGSGQVITSDMSIVERLFEKIMETIRNT